MDLTVLNELVLLDHLLELGALHKIVVDTILFARARFPCSVRHAEAKPARVVTLRQALDESALTDTGWARYNQWTVLLSLLERLQSGPVHLHLPLDTLH